MYNELNNVEIKDKGYVYVLYNSESELVKIGMTKNPKERFSNLTNQNGVKMRYYLSPAMYIENLVEKAMHNKFHRFKVKGEWYQNCSFDEVVSTLKDILESEDFKRRNVIK